MTEDQPSDFVPSRHGIVDQWNARFVQGAKWTDQGNPCVKTTAVMPPSKVISWRQAARIHKENLRHGKVGYRCNAFIHTCIDDVKFDGKRAGIWADLSNFISVAAHFGGVACVDFSTCADFPEPLLRWQFYRIRVVEFALAQAGVPVIVNARWATRDTWSYSIAELPTRSMLSVGTVGSGLKLLVNRPTFDAGLREIVRTKEPTCLVVIGSKNYSSIREAENAGVRIIQFDGETASAFKKVTSDE